VVTPGCWTARARVDLKVDELGLTQRMVASYEVGRGRVPLSLLPAIAEALTVSLERLIGQKAAPAKREPAPKAPAKDRAHSEAATRQQRFVKEMLDTVNPQVGR
jgi:transcriptional regulator with XRE-family HTH domain